MVQAARLRLIEFTFVCLEIILAEATKDILSQRGVFANSWHLFVIDSSLQFDIDKSPPFYNVTITVWYPNDASEGLTKSRHWTTGIDRAESILRNFQLE